MSENSFVQFYSEYLPKHPEIKRQVDSADTAKKFAAANTTNGLVAPSKATMIAV